MNSLMLYNILKFVDLYARRDIYSGLCNAEHHRRIDIVANTDIAVFKGKLNLAA